MAETGIGLSASEYFFQADGFIDDLSVATDTEVAYWTPNYNGVNSIVSIPEWKPAGEFEIECDVYVTKRIPYTVGMILAFQVYAPYFMYRDTGFEINTDGATPYKIDAPTNAFAKIRLTNQSLTVNGSSITVPTFNNFNIDRIGDYGHRGLTFKGQISNLKLIDKQNPENSRFYPGIIYSYVDPDATAVPMPSSTVLVDEWGDGSTNGIMTNFGTTQPHVPLLGDREEYCGNYTTGGFVRGVDTLANRLSASGAAAGSFSGKLSVGDVLTAEGVSLTVSAVVDANTVEYTSLDSDIAVQNTFQYPNTFIVTPFS